MFTERFDVALSKIGEDVNDPQWGKPGGIKHAEELEAKSTTSRRQLDDVNGFTWVECSDTTR